MRRRRRPIVTLFASISANGMIARPDDDAGFLTDANWAAWVDLAREAGSVAWGRRAHEMYRGAAVPALRGGLGMVLTLDPPFEVEEGWRVVSSPEEAVELATFVGAKGLVVSGGATVNAAFARAGLLDRVVLDVESVVIGEGVPLFATGGFDLPLRLREVVRLSESVAQLRYDVERPA